MDLHRAERQSRDDGNWRSGRQLPQRPTALYRSVLPSLGRSSHAALRAANFELRTSNFKPKTRRCDPRKMNVGTFAGSRPQSSGERHILKPAGMTLSDTNATAITATVVAVATLLIQPPGAQACTCVGPIKTCGALAAAGSVFEATVDSIRLVPLSTPPLATGAASLSTLSNNVTLRDVRAWRGAASTTVMTAPDAAACGVRVPNRYALPDCGRPRGRRAPRGQPLRVDTAAVSSRRADSDTSVYPVPTGFVRPSACGDRS